MDCAPTSESFFAQSVHVLKKLESVFASIPTTRHALLGLPRIASTGQDLQFILDQTSEPANGITFCSGSLGARPDNNLPDIMQRVASRIYFVHLRSTKREAGHDAFYEAAHLAGDVDIVTLMKLLVTKSGAESPPEMHIRYHSAPTMAIRFSPTSVGPLFPDIQQLVG